MSEKNVVAVVGLGRMGAAMAHSVLRAIAAPILPRPTTATTFFSLIGNLVFA